MFVVAQFFPLYLLKASINAKNMNCVYVCLCAGV